jgi:hypothetical protein
VARSHGNDAVSYLPICPPLWATLPSDHNLYPRPVPLKAIPDIIALDDNSSCLCSKPRTTYSPFLAIEQRRCTIYTVTQAYPAQIQVQRCVSCASKYSRFIGPEPRNLGLFNYNNQIIFAHDLLDEYTSAFTSSETPFAAWVVTASRRYQVHQSPISFVSEKVFRNIWFSYVVLQSLDTGMNCPHCGPDPQDTIWDGVTLAFSQKYQLDSLCPPTTVNEKSLQRQEVRYRGGLQLIPEAQVRKAVRFVIQGPSLVLNSDDDQSDDDMNDQGRRGNRSEKAKQELLSRVETIPGVCTKLKLVKDSLGALFNMYYGASALLRGKQPPVVYKRLFLQVSLFILMDQHSLSVESACR